MNGALLFFALSLASAITIAGPKQKPDEAVIREMARQTDMREEEIRQDFNACDSGHTVRMMICARYLWVVEDMRLNRILKRALAGAKKEGYEASFVNAQRAWLVYRDALCKYEGELRAGGGRENGLYMLSCMKEVTRQRADYLRVRLSSDSK